LSRGGLPAALTTWQTYVMVLMGALAMFLLQAAFNAGPLTMAQPGITIADPVVSVLWGIFGYGETVRTGGYLLIALLGAAMMVAGAYGLSHSSVISGTPAPTTPGRA